MDPNANLTEQLEIARKDWTGKESDELNLSQIDQLLTEHILLCELVAALDGWITSGGFLPGRWNFREGKK